MTRGRTVVGRESHALLAVGPPEWTVPDKPTNRLQHYRLTDAGRDRLESRRDPVNRGDDE